MWFLAVVAGLFLIGVEVVPAWGAGPIEVTAVRHSVVGMTTRITVDVTGDFAYRSDRLHNPERIFFDLYMAKPRIGARNVYAQALSDRLVSRIRMAETSPGVTRIVLDLATQVEFSVSRIASPPRLVIDLKGPDDAPAAPVPSAPIVASAPRPVAVTASAPALVATGATRTLESVPAAQPASEAARFAPEPPGLQISPAAAFRGDRAIVVVSLNAKHGSPSVGLQWELSYPAVSLGTDEREVVAGGAALSAGKTLTCTGVADDAATYVYRCVLAGGSTPIPNGPVAQMIFRVRESARLGPTPLEIRNAMAVAPDGKRVDITPTRADITVQ